MRDEGTVLLLLSGPGMGHINPMCQLAIRYTDADPTTRIVLIVPHQSKEAGGHLVELPRNPRIIIRHLAPDGVLDNLDFMTLIGTESSAYAAVVCDNLKNNLVGYSKPFRLVAGDESSGEGTPEHFDAILYDMFVPPALEIGSKLAVPIILFCPSPLPFYYFSRTNDFLSDKPLEPLHLPGIGVLPASDLPEMRGVDSLVPLVQKTFQASTPHLIGVLLNDVEAYYSPELIYSTQQAMKPIPNLIFIGPLLGADPRQHHKSNESSPEIRFLDKQQPGSTLLVAFGSWGAIADYDRLQLARALERCNRPVIWAYRKKLPNAFVPPHKSETLGLAPDEPLGDDGLPLGFIERNSEKILCSSWVAQEDILRHPSLGGFMTHAGWNSTSEALYLSNGVPLLCTPVGAEQAMNSAWLTSCGAAERTWRNPFVDHMDTDDILMKIEHIFTDPSIKANAKRLHALTAYADSHSSLESARLSLQLIREFKHR